MAKPTRRERDRRATEAAQSSTSTSPSGTPRAGRRSRRVTQTQRSFLDRFGGILLLAFTVAGVLILLSVFVVSSTSKTYACDSLLTPGPVESAPSASASPAATATPDPNSPRPSLAPGASATPEPTPEPAATPHVGFPVDDLGRSHVRDTNQVIKYAYCPPASGNHWAIAGEAPAPRAFYGPEEPVQPQQWIHNLEHGFVLALYSCGADGKSCPSAAELAELEKVFDDTPSTDGAVSCGVPNKVLVARFDDMATRFAYVSWDRELLADKADAAQGIAFAEQWIDPPAAPERGLCFR